MQLRISRKSTNGKTYQYAQLVESYRRESDGMPMHRVVANLGVLSPLEIENWRTALAAGRRGRRVAEARTAHPRAEAAPKILANLRYLDVAVLLSIWDEWGLTPLLADLLPAGQADVAPAVVVAALSIQRCVDPGSKLYATQWFPRSALPELLGIAPAAFNNTRVHRVLEEIERVTPALMGKLARRYQEHDGGFTAMFLDVTDTWFVGHGPEMAEIGKTKAGHVARKIGIVLLCNQHGYPLRWKVVQGAEHDSIGMSAMLRSVAGLKWVGETPIVFDRAMGHTAHLRTVLATGLRFVTALVSTEFEAYSRRIPSERFVDFAVSDADEDPDAGQADVLRAAELAEASGLEKIADDLFVLDLGIVEHADDEPPLEGPASPKSSPREVVAAGRRIRELMTSGEARSVAEAGRTLGLAPSVTRKYVALTGLAEDIQHEILEGHADGCTLADLLLIAKVGDVVKQRQKYQRLLTMPIRPKQAARRAQAPHTKPAPTPGTAQPATNPLRVRAVAYFNPERFIEERTTARRTLAKIRSFVDALNGSLGGTRSRRTKQSVAALVDRTLHKNGLVDVFAVTLHEETRATQAPRLRVELTLRPAVWERRRRYDGFMVLVAHPSISSSPEALCRLYRAKDVVEKDFQTIKSFVELRPIWHHTLAKVSAHVTICMLALLLERTLQQRLGGTLSAKAALNQLEPCRLNRYQASGGHVAYQVTELDRAQASILRTLRKRDLGESDVVTERITAR